jgi:hypothetical protein
VPRRFDVQVRLSNSIKAASRFGYTSESGKVIAPG